MNNDNINNNYGKDISVWLGIFVPVECILLQYRVGIFNIGVLLLLLNGIWIFISKRNYIVDKDFLKFMMILTCQQFCSAFLLNGDMFNRFWNVFLSILIFASISIALNNSINIDKFSLVVMNMGLLICIPLFYQAIQVYIFGNRIDAIMILPQSEQYLHYWAKASTRVCGFFTEPQTCASYVLPFVFISLRYKRFLYALIFSLAILFTGSSLGILTLVFLWALYILSSDLQLSKKIMIVAFTFIVGILLSSASFFEVSINKINTIFTDFSVYSSANIANSTSYSNYLRLIKGWVTLKELPLSAKLAGVGISGFQNYIQSRNISFSWTSLWDNFASNAGYYSSASGVFLECGIIVGGLYYFFYMKKIIKGSYEGRILLIIFLIQSFSTISVGLK